MNKPKKEFTADKISKRVIAECSSKIKKIVPNQLIKIADDLGYQLYAVGGCVRDPLLGKEVNDVDIAVVGDAEQLANATAKKLKLKDVAVYQRFGTALLEFPGFKLELATARAESYASDSRKPIFIEPVDIEIDLTRRDFTINALAISLNGEHKGEFLDLFDGITDLKNHIIKTPLDPDTTFSDDPLRMLRAIRFASEFSFQIEKATWDGLVRNRSRIEIVPFERVGYEIVRMLKGNAPVTAMHYLIESGLMQSIIPEVMSMAGVEQIGRHQHKEVLLHSLKVMQNVVDTSDDYIVRFAGLLHDIGKPRTKRFDPVDGWSFHGHEVLGARMVQRICRRLALGKKDSEKLVNLVRLHMRPINLTSEEVTDSAVRRLMVEAGEYLQDLVVLCRADITTSNPRKVTRYLANFDDMVFRMGDVEQKDKLRKFQSPLRGAQIMEICNISPGPLVGAIKEQIEEAILEGEITNDEEAAKKYLFSIKDDLLNADFIELMRKRRERNSKILQNYAQYDIPDEMKH